MPAVPIWRRDLEHMPPHRGLNAPALAAHAAVQEQVMWPAHSTAVDEKRFELLDFLALTSACGPACSRDGVHFDRAANLAAIQVLVNVWTFRRSDAKHARCSG
jgi:hypothetical protein